MYKLVAECINIVIKMLSTRLERAIFRLRVWCFTCLATRATPLAGIEPAYPGSKPGILSVES